MFDVEARKEYPIVKKIGLAAATIAIIPILFLFLPHPAAYAGMFDRIKDIYNTPEKLDELQQQYTEAQAQIESQAKQLEDSLLKAEELSRKQSELIVQNEELAARNSSLQAELDQMKRQRASLMDKLITAAIVIASVIALYFASVRIWRFAVWRKQRNAAGRGISG